MQSSPPPSPDEAPERTGISQGYRARRPQSCSLVSPDPQAQGKHPEVPLHAPPGRWPESWATRKRRRAAVQNAPRAQTNE